jgi:hypothetical protein
MSVIPGITKELLTKAQELRNQGMPWKEMARELGVTAHRLRMKLDPHYYHDEIDNMKRKKQREERHDYYLASLPQEPPLKRRDPLLERLKQGLR